MDETWVTPGDNTCFAHKDDNAILEPSALCVRFVLVNKLNCTDVHCEMMWTAMSSTSFASVKFATAKLKMKTLPAGFPVALCSTAIQFSDRHSNRSFLLLRIGDLVVDVVDVLDGSVSEIAAFPPSERLAF